MVIKETASKRMSLLRMSFVSTKDPYKTIKNLYFSLSTKCKRLFGPCLHKCVCVAEREREGEKENESSVCVVYERKREREREKESGPIVCGLLPQIFR